MTRWSVCIASRLAQGLDDRKIRRAPGWQQATGNSNQQGRDDSAQQRAQGEGRRKDHSADAHELVIETSREAQEYRQKIANDAAGQRKNHAFDEKTRQHRAAAEARSEERRVGKEGRFLWS